MVQKLAKDTYITTCPCSCTFIFDTYHYTQNSNGEIVLECPECKKSYPLSSFNNVVNLNKTIM